MIAYAIFLIIAVGYIYLMKIQGRLREGERFIYKEDKVSCAQKALFGLSYYRRSSIEITDKRVMEKELGICLRNITLNPNIKDKFGFINVLHADTAKVTTDEKGKECLELTCQSGVKTGHFRIRYYLQDLSKIKEQLR